MKIVQSDKQPLKSFIQWLTKESSFIAYLNQHLAVAIFVNGVREGTLSCTWAGSPQDRF